MTTRRNVLSMLGLATVSTAALTTDDIVKNDMGNGYRLSNLHQERVATALERLAAEVRAYSVQKGTGVNVSRFEVTSVAGPFEFLQQRLIIDLEMLHQDEPLA